MPTLKSPNFCVPGGFYVIFITDQSPNVFQLISMFPSEFTINLNTLGGFTDISLEKYNNTKKRLMHHFIVNIE
jgi:hypothetical protein